MYARAANRYRRVAVESAPPARLLDELLVCLLGDLERAGRAIAARDLAEKGRLLGHAIAIVDELAFSLDHDAAPALCANLAALYDFVRGRITDANLRVEGAPLAEAGRVLEVLRHAFCAVAATGTP